MAAKYGEVPHSWKSRTPEEAMECSLWKGISIGEDSLFRYVRYKINNGEWVCFWLDLWCERGCLARLFPNCYVLSECKRGSVNDHMIRTQSLFSWNIQLRKNLND